MTTLQIIGTVIGIIFAIAFVILIFFNFIDLSDYDGEIIK